MKSPILLDHGHISKIEALLSKYVSQGLSLSMAAHMKSQQALVILAIMVGINPYRRYLGNQ